MRAYVVTKLEKPNVRTVTQESVKMTKQSEIQRMFKELIERMEKSGEEAKF